MPANLNIPDRSEEFEDILGKMPGWIIRNGIVMVLFCITVFLVGSWFFRYPDLILSPIVVTAENPPANLVARSSGQIQSLFVADQQKVSKGKILAVIENPGDYKHIVALRDSLRAAEPFFATFDTTQIHLITTGYLLGDLQSDYSVFLKEYHDFQVFLRQNYYSKKIASLRQQNWVEVTSLSRMNKQTAAILHDYQIAVTQFRRDSSLFLKDVISLADFERSKSNLLGKKSLLEGIQSDLEEIKLAKIGLDQKIIDAEKEFNDAQTSFRIRLTEAYNTLKNGLSNWELKYLLTSPVDGIVSLNKIWSETQNVKEGDVVMTVIPEASSKLMGRVELPIKGSGKVKVGQKVNVKFDNYPYMEYGMVRGVVRSISLVPTNNVYRVDVEFPNGLVTNYKISLEMSREIQGTAEIITDELRLLQRVFNPIKSLIKEKVLN